MQSMWMQHYGLRCAHAIQIHTRRKESRNCDCRGCWYGGNIFAFFMFLFIRTRNDDEVNGSKAGGGTAESGEGQEKSAGCDSFTIYETSAVTQWISKNWGEGLSQCDFTELAQRGTLMVRQPGTDADYAMFVIEEKLLKYEFYRQIHGTYLGAGGEGVNVYLIDAD